MIIPVSLPSVAVTSKTFTNYVPLPPIADCPAFPLALWLNNLSDSWNCNLCSSESPYFVPFERGDILSFQLALPDRKNPSPNLLIAGWQLSTNPPFVLAYVKAQMYNCEGTVVIFDDVDLFAVDYWVAFVDGFGSVQNFTVDTAALPIGLTEFRIKVTTFDLSNNVDVVQWSEPYKIPNDCNDSSVLIESSWANLDCTPHYHGIPTLFLAQSSPPPVGYVPTPYRSRLRLIGELYWDSVATSQTTNENDRVLSQTITETYKLQGFEPLPPFAAAMLRDALFGDNLTIDGDTYTNPSELTRGGDAGRAFLPDLTVEKKCENFNKKCN